jgi:hypothetical protein
MNACTIRLARPDDQAGAYYVCLKTGDYGKDGEPFYREDRDALGRIFVGPYLFLSRSTDLEDEQGLRLRLRRADSKAFYARYESSGDCNSVPVSMPQAILPLTGHRPSTLVSSPTTSLRSRMTCIRRTCMLTCWSGRGALDGDGR